MDTQFIDLILNGEYLPAVGIAMVFVTGLARAGLGWIHPWFSTKLGGYATAYVVSFSTVFGLELQAGHTPTTRMLMMALSAALVASGVLDHWRDVFSVIKRSPTAAATTALLVLTLACSADCAGTAPTPNSVITAVVTCTAPDGDVLRRIETEVIKIGAIVFGNGVDKLHEAEVIAVNDGLVVGGCAFAQVINDWLSKKSLVGAADVAEARQAKTLFESYRAGYAGGATFRTRSGDI